MLMTMLEKITLIGLFGPLSVGRGPPTNAGPSPTIPPHRGLLHSFGGARRVAGRESRESPGPRASTAGTPPTKAI
jgi:hypothetical protein